MFLGARTLLTDAKYMDPRASLCYSVHHITNLDLWVFCSSSNPIYGAVVYMLGFDKIHDIHVKAAGQSSLIQLIVTEAMIFQVSALFLRRYKGLMSAGIPKLLRGTGFAASYRARQF